VNGVVIGLAGTLLAADAVAGVTIEGKPKVVFHAEGSPGFLTFDGVTRDLEVVDDGTTITFTVSIDTVQTGLSLRDQHMRDNYVETAKFPSATLAFARAAVTWPDSGRSSGEVEGAFTVHGVVRETTVEYTIKRSGEVFGVKASFAFDTSTHGIAIPEYMGVTIKPAMKADISVDLVDAR